MMKKTAVAFCLLLSACATEHSHQNAAKLSELKLYSPHRFPSSSIEEVGLEESFNNLLKSENPVLEYENYLKRLTSIHLRSEAFLYEFDKELENSKQFSLEDSKSYLKLIAMWNISQRVETKLEYHYARLLAITNGQIKESPKNMRIADNVLKSFYKNINSEDIINKLAFDQIKDHLLIIESNIKNKSFKNSKINKSFESDKDRIAAIKTNRATMRALGKFEDEQNDEITQALDESVSKLHLDTTTREPQSDVKVFYPSVGQNGNIFGKVFPKNVWALTYDDGPHPTYSPQVFKNLEDLGIKATFFWLAENVITHQKIVDLAKEKNLPREDHSWTHAQLPKLDDAGLNKEIVQSKSVEEKSYGETIRFFRCPYGAGLNVPKIRKMIADLNMIHVYWNVDTLDWQDKDPDSIVERAKKEMAANGHGVILFHDIHPQSVIASKKLVEWSKTLKGSTDEIRWVTIPEIVDEMNSDPKSK